MLPLGLFLESEKRWPSGQARFSFPNAAVFGEENSATDRSMAKKKNDYSVLTEVNTEDEWLTLCEREVVKYLRTFTSLKAKY